MFILKKESLCKTVTFNKITNNFINIKKGEYKHYPTSTKE